MKVNVDFPVADWPPDILMTAISLIGCHKMDLLLRL